MSVTISTESLQDIFRDEIEKQLSDVPESVIDYLADVFTNDSVDDFDIPRLLRERPQADVWGNEFSEVSFSYHKDVTESCTRVTVQFPKFVKHYVRSLVRRGGTSYRTAAVMSTNSQQKNSDIYSFIGSNYIDILSELAGRVGIKRKEGRNIVLYTPKGRAIIFN